MDGNIQNKKIELIQWVSTLNDMSIIEKHWKQAMMRWSKPWASRLAGRMSVKATSW
jgi:hypothetical protein